MSSFITTYGGDLAANASGLAAVKRAEAAGLSIGQIQQMSRDQGIAFGPRALDYFQEKNTEQFTTQLTQFQQQLQDQQTRFQEQFDTAQRDQQARLEALQQQALQAQIRQTTSKQAPQVLGVGKSLAIRRLGASTRFSRPELQIKSVNI